ncbi:DUF3267 domain-containing protein [Cytobacillus praedii]|uniref:DUF3267 domain-containing protein n=1 Tax=Cytobacillus praedii TaxID=1742358 RepID=UPI003AF8760C
MILWFRHLPQVSMDLSKWTPFIRNHWLRTHYMKFVYLLQVILFLLPFLFKGWFPPITAIVLFLIGIFVFILHEILHIIVINKKGDFSLTFSGIFFWLHTNATLSKRRFWTFMSLPFMALSVVPFIVSLFLSEDIKSILLFVSWINAVISASDIINSFLIAIKPKNSVFCKGYYRLQ